MSSRATLRKSLQALPVGPELMAALLAEECRRNPQLLARLREDARGCLQESMAEEPLPKTLRIEVHENRDDTWHLPLPNILPSWMMSN